jgi:hypothetical protein
MRMRLLAVVVTFVALVPVGPARAATASCGGTSPVETSCTVKVKLGGRRVTVRFATNPLFAGVLQADLRAGSKHASLTPCPTASLALDPCVGTVSGVFRKGDVVTMKASVLPDPVLGLPLGAGLWTATISG